MALRDIALTDMKFIVEGDVAGWRYPIELTDPDGNVSVDMYGLSNDVALFIDPSTGLPISGRQASVAISIDTVAAQGLVGFPQAIDDVNQLPWVVKFNDINGSPFVFKVVSSLPDRALGVLVLILEIYEQTP